MKRLARLHDTRQRPLGARTDNDCSYLFDVFGGQRTVDSGVPKNVAISEPHGTVTRSTEPRCICKHGVEYLLQFPRRACDNLQHISRRSLLLRDSERSSVRWWSSLSSRAFSIAMTACAAKFLTRSICLSVKAGTSGR